jgi:hypothetical protein
VFLKAPPLTSTKFSGTSPEEVFVEGTDCYNGVCGWQGGNLIGVASHPVTLSVPNQLVYSAHDYGPNLFQQAWFNSSTTPASLTAIWGQYWGFISAGGIAPVWLGEFGTTNNNADIENTAAGSQGQWFQALVGFLQAGPTIQWTYWALNGEDTYGLLDSNYDQTPANALKQSLLAGIQSPLGGGAATPGFTLAPSSSTVALTPRHTAMEWQRNPEWRQRVGYQRELQRQYSIRRQLFRNGIQRHVEQHDQCRTHLVCRERSGLPIVHFRSMHCWPPLLARAPDPR